MLVLEHATFAAPKNEAALVGLLIPHAPADDSNVADNGATGNADAAGGPSLAGEHGEPFPQWLVRNLTAAVGGPASPQFASEPAAGQQVPLPCAQHEMAFPSDYLTVWL